MNRNIEVILAAGYEYTDTDYIPLHSHGIFQIFYLVSGTGKYSYDNEIITLNEGDFLLVFPFKIHGMINCDGRSQTVLDIKFMVRDNMFAQNLTSIQSRNINNSDEVKQLFTLLYKEAFQKKTYFGDLISNYLESILYLSFRRDTDISAHDSIKDVQYSKLSTCARRTLKYIEGCFLSSSTHSLEEIAETLSYNKNYMCRCFHEETGMSIGQYLNLLRIDKAKELLITTNQEVKEISSHVGFTDVSYMTRLFKKTLGVNPTEYRKQKLDGDHFLSYTFRESVKSDMVTSK